MPRSSQTTTVAAKTSISESRPKPIRPIEPAAIPAKNATTASRMFQSIVRYSSSRPWRRSKTALGCSWLVHVAHDKFAVGALDAYLSDVSAEVMIHQCEHGLVTGDTRAVMKSVSQQLPGLALELAVAGEGADRVERLRAAIVDHFQTTVSGHGPESVAKALERMGGRASELWRGLEEAGFADPAMTLDHWTDKRHRIVHRGEKVSVPWKQGRECLELLTAVAGAVDFVAEGAMTP